MPSSETSHLSLSPCAVMRFGICCSLKTCGKTQVRQRYSEESMSQRKLIRMGPQKQSRWVGKQQQQQLK